MIYGLSARKAAGTVKAVCALLTAAVLLGTFACFISSASSQNGETGTVSVCEYLSDPGTVHVSGTVNHKVFRNASNATVGLLRIEPSEDPADAINTAEFLVSAPISVRFDFTVPCRTAEERLSAYVPVICYSDGKRSAVSDAVIPSSSSASSVRGIGFKGIAGGDAAYGINNSPESTVIDVFADRLVSDSKSGYFYVSCGDFRYFDRSYTDELDRRVRSFRACGADVLFRICLSEGAVSAFAVNGPDGKSCRLSVDSYEVASDLYSAVCFLLSRYYQEFGNVAGIIAGRSVDLACDAGTTASYAYALAVIGCAVSDCSGGRASVVVPVSDQLLPDGTCSFESFASDVAETLGSLSSTRISLMFELTHNPYGLDGSFYEGEGSSGEGEDGITDPPDTTEAPEETSADPDESVTSADPDETGTPADSGESTSSDVTHVSDVGTSPEGTGSSTDISPVTGEAAVTDPGPEGTDEAGTGAGDNPDDTTPGDTTAETEPPVTEEQTSEPETQRIPRKNTGGEGFYAADFMTPATRSLAVLRDAYYCVSSDWTVCWFPEEDTGEALGSCYAYSYVSMMSAGASSFIIDTENLDDGDFDGIAYLFRYVSTAERSSVLSQYPAEFGVNGWDELVPGSGNMKKSQKEQKELPLSFTYGDITGSYDFWDFSSGGGTLDWYPGIGCASLKAVSDGENEGLRASFENSGYSDIGVICGGKEPLLYCDALSFDLSCTGVPGRLYEIKIFIYSDKIQIQASAAVAAGTHSVLYIDTSSFPDDTEITSIRIGMRPINPDEEESGYGILLRKVSLNSRRYGSSQLSSMISSARQVKHSEISGLSSRSGIRLAVVIPLAVLSVITVAAFAAADKKQKNTDK